MIGDHQVRTGFQELLGSMAPQSHDPELFDETQEDPTSVVRDELHSNLSFTATTRSQAGNR